eukprot:TRINITY_DN48268_c0_g1_i1.p1 TRINITY_DN48268_c0_g1~~TRINITY_DN48268_c0_g1_i1.p1  ORF type:complete len:1136 (+),score=184.71 TRINITY_DN48268_c0_g1_i1:71-3478(+)
MGEDETTHQGLHLYEASPAAWLFGALLSELSAVLHTLGITLIRRATIVYQRRHASSRDEGGHGDIAGRHVRYRTVSEETVSGKIASHALAPGQPALMPWSALLLSPSFWSGITLRGLGCIIWWEAGCNAPATTVAPLFLCVSLFTNLVCGPSLLQEQYKSREVFLCLFCIACVAAGSVFDAAVINPWPRHSVWLVNLHHIQKGEGQAIICCSILWLIAVMYFGQEVLKHCLPLRRLGYGRRFPELSKSSKRYAVAIPVVGGLMSGAAYFEEYVGLPVCDNKFKLSSLSFRAEEEAAWLVAVVIVSAFSLILIVEGTRSFDCRYFVPAYSTVGFFTASAMRVLLVQHEPVALSCNLFCAGLLHLTVAILPFFCICSEPVEIKLPHTLKWETSPLPTPNTQELTPFRHGTVEPLPLVTTPLLELYGEDENGPDGLPEPVEEEGMLQVSTPKGETGIWLFDIWATLGALSPVAALASVPVAFALLALVWLKDGGTAGRYPSLLSMAVAIYCGLTVGGAGLRTSVFASVARWRMMLCMNTDYTELCQAGRKRRSLKKRGRMGGGRAVVISDPFDTPGSSSSEDDDETFWQTVRHFVVVEGLWNPTESRSLEELRSLLVSIAASPIAAKQVCVFLTVKESAQEESCQRAASILHREFQSNIHLVTYLGPDAQKRVSTVPDRPAGLRRRPESRSIASLLMKDAARIGTPDRVILVTRTAIDSLLHPSYFCALTFAFLNSGVKRGSIIFQPPVLFLKDYLLQPWITRHACLFLAQSSLASLVDPMAVPLPKSTYSMSLSLMRGIEKCWDPDLLVQPYNIGVWTKCWLASIGRSSLQPIFLPVYRSGCDPVLDDVPVADTNGSRKTRSRDRGGGGGIIGDPLRVQVLHLLELVHFSSALPLAWISGRRRPGLRKDRLFSLLLRSLPPFFSMAWNHIVMSTWFAAMIVNILCILHAWLYWPDSLQGEGSTALLLGIMTLVLGLVPSPMLVMSHVCLLRMLPPLVDGSLVQNQGSTAPSVTPHMSPDSSPVAYARAAAERAAKGGRLNALTQAGTQKLSSEAGGVARLLAAIKKRTARWWDPRQKPMLHGVLLGTYGLFAGPVFLCATMLEEWRLALSLGLGGKDAGPPTPSNRVKKVTRPSSRR